MFPVGIDVSKETLDLCMLYDGMKVASKHEISATTAARLSIYFAGSGFSTAVGRRPRGDGSDRRVSRTAGHGPARCRFLCVSGQPSPQPGVARGMGIMTKTDKVDAYMLACYALLKKPHRWEPPAADIRFLSALLRGGMCCSLTLCARKTGSKNISLPKRLQMSSVHASGWRSCSVKK